MRVLKKSQFFSDETGSQKLSAFFELKFTFLLHYFMLGINKSLVLLTEKIFAVINEILFFFAALQKVVLKTGMQSMYLKISMYNKYRVPHAHSDHLIYRRMLGSDK